MEEELNETSIEQLSNLSVELQCLIFWQLQKNPEEPQGVICRSLSRRHYQQTRLQWDNILASRDPSRAELTYLTEQRSRFLVVYSNNALCYDLVESTNYLATIVLTTYSSLEVKLVPSSKGKGYKIQRSLTGTRRPVEIEDLYQRGQLLLDLASLKTIYQRRDRIFQRNSLREDRQRWRARLLTKLSLLEEKLSLDQFFLYLYHTALVMNIPARHYLPLIFPGIHGRKKPVRTTRPMSLDLIEAANKKLLRKVLEHLKI